MKIIKILLQVLSAVLVVVGFVACEDDEGGCINCTLNYGGQTYTEQVCEEDFNSIDEFNQYIASIELIGGNCN